MTGELAVPATACSACPGSFSTSPPNFWAADSTWPRTVCTPAGSMRHFVIGSADRVDGRLGLLQGVLGGGVVLLQRAAQRPDDRPDLAGDPVPPGLLGGVLLGDAVGQVVRHGRLDVAVARVDEGLQPRGHGVEVL